MTAQSLLIAVSVGLIIGLTGRLLTGRGRSVPVWLPVAAGVGAAVLATMLTRMADGDATGPTVIEVALDFAFAATGVAAVVTTADRQSPRTASAARHGTDHSR